MLRITVNRLPGIGSRLQLEGRLIGPWVAELRREADAAGAPLWLDLRGVQYADIDGVILLRELLARRAVAENVSPFLEALLGKEGGNPALGGS